MNKYKLYSFNSDGVYNLDVDTDDTAIFFDYCLDNGKFKEAVFCYNKTEVMFYAVDSTTGEAIEIDASDRAKTELLNWLSAKVYKLNYDDANKFVLRLYGLWKHTEDAAAWNEVN